MTEPLLLGRHIISGIEQRAQESFYCSTSWLDLITSLYRYTLTPLTTTDATGQLTGYLPICAVADPFGRRRLVALPFSDQCPLLATDAASANQLVDAALLLAEQQHARYLELRTGPSDVLARRTELAESNLYVRWLVPLNRDPADAWSALQKSVQQKVSKARRLGVQVRVAQAPGDVARFYRLHLRTRSKKHGMPAQPARFFHALWDAHSSTGGLRLLVAESEGEMIAGAMLLRHGSTIHYAYAASHEGYLHLAPNNLLLWEAITWGCSQGSELLDLGRTARDNSGLMQFKRGWGAFEEPLPYYYYPCVAGLAATSESSWKARTLNTSWKRLPLWLSQPFGSYLYRYLG